MTTSEKNTQALLRIRPAMPDPEDKTSRGPALMEPAISAMHYLKGKGSRVSFELASFQGKISYFVRASRSAASLIESQLYAQYPDVDIEEVAINLLSPKPGEVVVSRDFKLQHPEVYPIKRYSQFDDLLLRQNIDSMASITATLVRYPDPSMRGHIQVIVSPLDTKFRKRVLKFLPLLKRGFAKRFEWYGKLFTRAHLARGWMWFAYLPLNILMGGFRAWFSFLPSMDQLMMPSEGDAGADSESLYSEEYEHTGKRSHENEDMVTAIADKANRLLFSANVRVSIITRADKQDLAEAKLIEIESSFSQFTLPHSNGFKPAKLSVTPDIDAGYHVNPFVLSVEELATLWHFPNILVKTPNIDWVLSKKLEPPVDLPMPENEEDVTVLGEAVFRGHRNRFGIRPDDRRRHMYIIGKTGMGKSTLLENMIFTDIHAGKGVGVIDPHGDLIEAILKFVPAERSNDVILFDPADKNHPLSFNMLHADNPDHYPLVVSGLMSVFTKLWPDVWSGRMEHILRSTLMALIEAGGNSMLGILRMYSDDVFRAKIVQPRERPPGEELLGGRVRRMVRQVPHRGHRRHPEQDRPAAQRAGDPQHRRAGDQQATHPRGDGYRQDRAGEPEQRKPGRGQLGVPGFDAGDQIPAGCHEPR